MLKGFETEAFEILSLESKDGSGGEKEQAMEMEQLRCCWGRSW